MSDAAVFQQAFTGFDGPYVPRAVSPRTFCGAVALLLAVTGGGALFDARSKALPALDDAPMARLAAAIPAQLPTPVPVAPAPAPRPAPRVAPDVIATLTALPLSTPVEQPAIAPAPPPALAPTPTTTPETAAPTAIVAMPANLPAVVRAVEPVAAESVPLPVPRPPNLRARPKEIEARQPARPPRPVMLPATPPDNRSFFEKIFGGLQPTGPALSYAAPETSIISRATSEPAAPTPYDRWTAVYDIAAHTVYMPDGAKLEAHSGLGDKLDDPRFVTVRMRGPTPPHVYDLTPREQLFHGVKALRLNPVGNGNVFGRTGLLAHTYMLGPNGDSNGCVSFKDYNAFLQAYESGSVKRLAVISRRI